MADSHRLDRCWTPIAGSQIASWLGGALEYPNRRVPRGIVKPLLRLQVMKLALNETRRREDPLDVLLEAGKNGWELVTLTTNHVAYFKRPIEDTSQPEELRPVQPDEHRELPSAASPSIAASS
jgi:hypothetical protein